MLLQALADHLRRLAGLEILVILDLLVLAFELFLVLLLQRLLLRSARRLLGGQLVFERQNALLALRQLLRLALHGLGHGELFHRLTIIELRAELLDLLRLLREGRVLFRERFVVGTPLLQFDKVQLARLTGQQLLLAAPELLVELAVAHLPRDLRVARLVHLKDLPTVGAADLLHGLTLSFVCLFE